ncbi:MAG: hypothetical protein Q9217_001609 [Psora testacea]
MSPVASSASKHIPAWKKIGLKLTYAKEELEEDTEYKLPSTIVEVTSTTKKKRKISNNGEWGGGNADTEKAVKKFKKSKGTDVVVTSLVNGDFRQGSALEGKQSLLQPVDKTPARTRKSVSFAPETKAKDEDSVKQIYKTWLSSQRANDPSFDPSTLNPALRSIAPPKPTPNLARSADQPSHSSTDQCLESASEPPSTPPQAFAQPTKPKKRKDRPKDRPRRERGADSSQPDPPHLTYLHTYHTSPSTWKFSKPYQNHILKHLFSLQKIPSSFDPTLLSYLKGLKGGRARQRIRTHALEVREEDERWLSSEMTKSEGSSEEGTMEMEPDTARHERRRREYEAQVKRVKEMLRKKEEEREDREWEYCGGKELWERRLKRRRRAEVVLWGVGETGEADEAKAKQGSTTEQADNHLANGFSKNEWVLGRNAPTTNKATTAPTKIVFGNDDDAVAAAPTAVKAVNGINGMSNGSIARATVSETTHVQKSEPGFTRDGKKPRKRKAKKRTGVPDDDDDTDSSSDSSSSESEKAIEAKRSRAAVKQQKDNIESDSESSTSASSSDSDSEE